MDICLSRGVWPQNGQRLFLVNGFESSKLPSPCALGGPLDRLRAGDVLSRNGDQCLRVLGRGWWPQHGASVELWVLEALMDMDGFKPRLRLSRHRDGLALAWIVLSDKAAAGEREDLCGPIIAEVAAKALPLRYVQGFILPDDPGRLKSLLLRLAYEDRFDLVLTSGGTGLTPRDMTPEATIAVLERRAPGLERAMTNAGLNATPMACLSRSAAGVIGQTLVINLPGSPKAVRESLEATLPALEHGLAKLAGDPTDCGAMG
ncbi:MAG: hypothetical protein PWQ57_3010 [Desulfovibrionales bacterium]|jgi:molybdenum cofactor synthesis domain-containing protein|nr:hypothetical protein [Desulfovibrionales bacterium]